MPRPINLGDFEYQDVAGYPLSVDDRLQRWERTEELHWLNRSKSPTEFPGVLELIGQRPGEAGIVIAADRLLPLYEAGIPVLSTGGLLFGDRLLQQDLPIWDTLVQPGQAVCLTGYWYDAVHPRFSIPSPSGTKDFYPSATEWTEFLVDLAAKITRVTEQGSLVVLVFTLDSLQPSWMDLTDTPVMCVYTDGSGEEAFTTGHYVTTKIVANYYRGARALYQDSPLAPSYGQRTAQDLENALPLTSLFDYHPEIEHRM